MQFLAIRFVILTSIIFGTSTAFGFESRCSNALGTVDYAVNMTGDQLNVTFLEQNLMGLDMWVKKEINDFKITQVSEVILESNCSKLTGHGSAKILAFRKINITAANGSDLPANIVGLSQDRKTLAVDYLCETHGEAAQLCK